jgi:hypothetical protein
LRGTWRDCNFIDNLEKGFYSDSYNGDARFERCRFVGNGMGMMLEIPAGPVTLSDCTVSGNHIGVELVTAGNVTIERSHFVGNQVAALAFDPRSRRSVDTLTAVRTDPAYGSTVWGQIDRDGGMLREVELTTAGNVIRNSNFITDSGPSASLVRPLSTYVQPPEWGQLIYQSMRWSGNRFAHPAGEFPFAGPAGPTDGPGHLDATGFIAACVAGNSTSTGNRAETIARKMVDHDPAYIRGFSWQRAADWRACEQLAVTRYVAASQVNGGALGWDRLGKPTWLVRVTAGWPDSRGLAAGAQAWILSGPFEVLQQVPWRAGQQDRLIYRPFTEAGYATATTLRSEGWPNYQRGESFVEWRNPTGRAIVVSLRGSIKTDWFLADDRTVVDWAVAVVGSDDIGTLVSSGSAAPGGAPAQLDLTAMTVPAGGGVRWGVHYPGPHGIEHGVAWHDDLTMTLER